LDSAIMLGGIMAWLVGRFQKRQAKKAGASHDGAVQSSNRSGLLFASGLITGEALVGILLAIPIAITGSNKVLALVDKPLGTWPGVLGIGLLCAYLFYVATKAYQNHESAS